GPEIQFDTKGVEFGPWIRRFIAQVKRNWFIPYAAMSMKGHVVITFNVHKDGAITDLSVVGPCPVDAFNNAAFGALSSSNPTQPGKSALGPAAPARCRGEIHNCDSTAVYRGFDIGTDKVAAADRRGIPHHLIDIADPTEDYTAARYAREAATVIRDIHARGRLPVLVGGTGFYYRALTRGLFPVPARDAALRQRLDSIAE